MVPGVFEAFKHVFFNTKGQKKNNNELSKERKAEIKNKRPSIVGISPERYIFYGLSPMTRRGKRQIKGLEGITLQITGTKCVVYPHQRHP
jgi:hypothetical protein